MRLLPAALLLLLVTTTAAPSGAAVLTVTSLADSGPGSLREAVGIAAPGDTIGIPLSGEILLTTSPIVLDRNLRIEGPAGGGLVVRGTVIGERTLKVSPGVVAHIERLTVSGGGIENDGYLSVSNGMLANIRLNFGHGSVLLNRGAMQLSDVAMTDNGPYPSTSMVNEGTLSFLRCSIEDGGGYTFQNFGDLSLVDTTLNRGGLFHNYARLKILNSSIFHLSSDTAEAGINNSGEMRIENSELGHLHSTQFSGIRNSGTLRANGLSIHNARSRYAGIRNEGLLVASNCTFSRLETLRDLDGAQGLSNSGTAFLSNCTFAGNGESLAWDRPSIFNSGYLAIRSSIVGPHLPSEWPSPGPDGLNIGCINEGIVESFGNNIDTDGTCGFSGPGDLVADSLVGELQYLGGAAPTIPLLPGSPAIDAISPEECVFDDDENLLTPLVPLTVDQRGMPRPQGARCDIGAYERETAWGEQLLTCTDEQAVCEGDLSTASAALAQCQVNLAAAETVAAQATAALNQCDEDLGATQATLSTCESNLIQSQAEGTQCGIELALCLDDPGAIPDQDGDGEADPTDLCPDTAAGMAVDGIGCSRDQFCANVAIPDLSGAFRCLYSDWRNDQPLSRPQDCTVRFGGSGWFGLVCDAR